MSEFIYNLENIICGVPLVVLLMYSHIYFTIKLKFPQKYTFEGLKYMIGGDKKNTSEGISSFKSLMAVLASTLGTGNIIGVATAITIGGAGSIFWIFISGIFAIATKYAETYIVLKYRKKDKHGKFYGGAMYILRDRLKNKSLAKLFSIFLICTTLGMGAMIQSNAISSSIVSNYDINIFLLAFFIIIPCSYALVGNEKRIANISSVLIPVATIVYLISCFALIYIYRNNILSSIIYILKEAFNLKSCTGGFLGSAMVRAMNTGFSKGLFTNEAGMGTSPIFDVSVREKDIKKQSIISSTSVFIDTVLLCTMTGIVFVASGMCNVTTNPALIANYTFSMLPFGKYIFIFMIVVFAISTIPCSGFYGSIAMKFLSNERKKYITRYRLVYIICVFIGAISKIEIIWSISSIANGLMVIPNVIMLFKLRKEIN
jgi:AGCS family alanine or glycine:cation symporter